MKVLVLGGYGLVGREIARELLHCGFDAVGAGRHPEVGRRLLPRATWVQLDLNGFTHSDAWTEVIDGIDAVVNASGALQSGTQDDLAATQRDAICALISACEFAGLSGFVQISAPGADPKARTEFMRTKGEADFALRGSKLRWVILKPGLVLSEAASGGTSLLRSLAAFPWIQPVVLARARLQTVNARDVARAVVLCLREPSLARREFDLVEASPHTLESMILALREWLGFSPPVRVVRLPLVFGLAVAKLADFAGALGWRTPLRSTATQVLAGDVLGDPDQWPRATGQTLRSFSDTLAELPSTRQERISARVQLVFPFAAIVLSLFWIVSGLVGLGQLSVAKSLLSPTMGERIASFLVLCGSALDLSVGLGLLTRRTFRATCSASIVVSIGYLVLGSVLVPDLWLDPLGPYLKILPAILVALLLASIVEER